MRLLALILSVFVFGVSLAHADDKLRVGKAVAGPFDFVPLDIGLQKGFFKAHGVDVEEVDFDGSAKLQQGLGADAIDVGLGSGPELAFVAKGIPISRSRSSPGRRTARCSSSAPTDRCMRSPISRARRSAFRPSAR